MKAAIIQNDKSLKIEERPAPTPGPGELVVKVAYCGICGSDIHMLDVGILPPGCIIGHELSGHISAIGPDVEGWNKGEAVVVMPLDPCLKCEPCRHGNIQQCSSGLIRGYGLGLNPGAFAQYMLVKPSMLFKLPEDMDLKLAALNEPWSVALHGVNSVNFKAGHQAVVMGAGPIGLLCLLALKASGASRVFVSEPDPYRAECARKAGADKVFDPNRTAVGGEVLELTGRPADFVFECAGSANSMQEATGICGSRGHIVMLGVHQGNVTIFPLMWFAKEITLNFNLGYNHMEFSEGIKLLYNGAVKRDAVVSDVVPLKDIDKAFKDLHGSGHSKILVDCQAV